MMLKEVVQNPGSEMIGMGFWIGTYFSGMDSLIGYHHAGETGEEFPMTVILVPDGRTRIVASHHKRPLAAIT